MAIDSATTRCLTRRLGALVGMSVRFSDGSATADAAMPSPDDAIAIPRSRMLSGQYHKLSEKTSIHSWIANIGAG
jgi:hypothetical protein